MSQTNIEIVKSIYDAFVRGDVPHILNQLSDNVSWVNSGGPDVPYAGQRNGREGAAKFFSTLAESVDVLGFEAREYLSGADSVAAFGMFSARAKSTGKTYTYDWVMLWKFENGKVVDYRSFTDTRVESEAFANSASA